MKQTCYQPIELGTSHFGAAVWFDFGCTAFCFELELNHWFNWFLFLVALTNILRALVKKTKNCKLCIGNKKFLTFKMLT